MKLTAVDHTLAFVIDRREGSVVLTGGMFRCDENLRTRRARHELRLASRGKAR